MQKFLIFTCCLVLIFSLTCVASANEEYEFRRWRSRDRDEIGELVAKMISNDNTMVTIEFRDGHIGTMRAWEGRDIAYLMHVNAKFPETMAPAAKVDDPQLLVHLTAEDLELGKITVWENKGTLGGAFHGLAGGPMVEEMDGRKAVTFYRGPWLMPLDHPTMVSDFYAPKNIQGYEPFTVVAWLYHAGGINFHEVFLSVQSKAGDDGFYFGYGEQGRYSIESGVRRGAYSGHLGSMAFPDEGFPEPNQWQQLAWVYTGGRNGELRLYVNGNLVNRIRTGSNPGSSIDKYMFLGAHWGRSWDWDAHPLDPFTGHMGELRVYNYPLSAKELRNLNNDFLAFNPSPKDGVETDSTNVTLTWEPGVESEAFNLYLSTDKEAVTVGDKNAFVGKITEPKYDAKDLILGEKYYWRVDQVTADGLIEGTVWEFTAFRAAATNPTPAMDSEGVARNAELKWKPGSFAKGQILYLDSDPAKLGTEDAEYVVELGPRTNYYKAEGLDYSRTYYWRVDQVNGDNYPVSVGDVWSFKVEDYFALEFDGPTLEPFPKDVNHTPWYKVYLEGDMHPVIADDQDQDLLAIALRATNRLLQKRPDVQHALTAHNCATHMGRDWVWGDFNSEFTVGSYGDMKNVENDPNFYWGTMILVHEMGHQVHMFGHDGLEYDYRDRLNTVFQRSMYDMKWLGDYASNNLYEYMAVAANWWINDFGHYGDLVTSRWILRENNPELYFLLKDYWPGDTVIELTANRELETDSENNVIRWHNTRGIEYWSKFGFDFYDGTVGYFEPIGSPKQVIDNRIPAIKLSGEDALVWNYRTRQFLADNHEWSVEMWVRKSEYTGSQETLLSWGPKDGTGVRFVWGADELAYYHNDDVKGNWTVKPALNEWNHIVFVFEGGGLEDGEGELAIYINNEKVASYSHKFALGYQYPIVIGATLTDGGYEDFFAGSIGAVRVYNYDLGVLQIDKHYTGEKDYYRRQDLEVANLILVDLDANVVAPPLSIYPIKDEVRPFYPEATGKTWLRSWHNLGALGGRLHNDVKTDSQPHQKEIQGVVAIEFNGSSRMVSAFGPDARVTQGTLEAWVLGSQGTIAEWGPVSLDTSDLTPGRWQYVVATYENGVRKLYVDGKLIREETYEPSEFDVIDRLHLGASWNGEEWENYFTGAIAELRIHQGVLDQVQVLANYANSTMLGARIPYPENYGKLVLDRKEALSWAGSTSPKASGYDVYIGTDRAKVANATRQDVEYQGIFEPGTLVPELSPGTTYYWRVDPLNANNEPMFAGWVWEFATVYGKVIDLSAENLAEGDLYRWDNMGSAGGSFIAYQDTLPTRPEVVTVDGRKAVYFSGAMIMESSFGTPTQLTGNKPFTASMWVYQLREVRNSTVMSWSSRPNNMVQLQYGRDLRTGAFMSGNTGNTNFVGGIPPTTYWQHIVWTYTGGEDGELKIYVNGKLDTTKQFNLNTLPNGRIVLGAARDGQKYVMPFYGYLDDVAIFNYALDEEEIKYLYTNDGVAPDLDKRIVYLSAQDYQEGAIEEWANQGTLGGHFSAGVATMDRSILVEIVEAAIEQASADFVKGRNYVPWINPEFQALSQGRWEELGYETREDAFFRVAYILALFEHSTPGAVTVDGILKTFGSTALASQFPVLETITPVPKVQTVAGRKAVVFEQTGISELVVGDVTLRSGTMLKSDIPTPEVVALDNPFTVEMWVYKTTTGGEQTVFSLAPRVAMKSFPQDAMPRAANFNVGASAFNSGHDSRRVTWTTPSTGTWHHIAYVYSGGYRGEMKVYVDGKFVARKGHYALYTSTGYPMHIGGAWQTAGGAFDLFNGSVASVTVYDYVRTEQEIAQAAKQ
ncbi:MAG: LamG domain-containing protein [Firmicutes bacterium]|nr:LamG domain-containing protein [Bacillota bacterium]